MSDLEYSSLWHVIQQNSRQLDEIMEQYLFLLSQLTEAPKISRDKFMTNLAAITNSGYIYVCYRKTSLTKIEFIGSGTIIFEPKIMRNAKSCGHIEDIVVDEKYRSMGIAKEIIDKLIGLAKTKECYKVILDCKPELTGFYEKRGFERNGVQMSMYF
jgi:glucosamine-phosphate N-acetyltransferase